MNTARIKTKDEYLAQLGIKKGSSFGPWVALTLVLVGLYITFAPIGDQADRIYKEACAIALLANSSSTAPAGTAAPVATGQKNLDQLKRLAEFPKFQQFVGRCESGAFGDGNYEEKIYIFSELAENHAAPFLDSNILAFVPAYVDLLKGYFRNEFSGQFVKFSSDLVGSQLWILAWTAGIALLPGLLGMIYVRAF